jgi:hypothetical protein
LDKIVKLASDNSVNLIYTFGQTPSWASSRPFEVSNYGLGRAAEPSDANDWDAYVQISCVGIVGKSSFMKYGMSLSSPIWRKLVVQSSSLDHLRL